MAPIKKLGPPASLLNKQVASLKDLRSLPWTERLFHRPAVPGEKINLGPAQDWIGRQWDFRVGSINGTVYKVALEASAADRADAVSLSTEVFTLVQKVLGPPVEQHDGLYMWKADDGNVVLQFANVGGDRRIMLFLTSSVVRHAGVN